jgi:RNA polymerase sigma factor (sigma-70 family)
MVERGVEADDEALAARAAAGDTTAAFESIVSRYESRVYRLAFRLTGSEADAMDALQDTFLQVYRHLGSFRRESRFGTWLYRIATNAALMDARLVEPRQERFERFSGLSRANAVVQHASGVAERREGRRTGRSAAARGEG